MNRDEALLHLVSAAEVGQRFVEIVAVIEVQDFTVGIVWAIANTDTQLLADDASLDHYQARLAHYEELPASAATLRLSGTTSRLRLDGRIRNRRRRLGGAG